MSGPYHFRAWRAGLVWIGDRVRVPEHRVDGVVEAAVAPDGADARFLVVTIEPEPRRLWLARDRLEIFSDGERRSPAI